ncbi:MAG: sigma-54 dependent transcriptional regulator [Bacteroidia bacterium]|nr:sigma-54 dependent transcriptional regulator [Bacteroidia bacterium]
MSSATVSSQQPWIKVLQSHSIVTRSPAMRSIFERIDTIAQTDVTILITGETGVGKELVAEYIHRINPRSQHSFIKVGLAALPPELLESELFGHEQGAFTHAMRTKKGLFELANKGTILLDDIDDFPLHLQVKLLRVLEERALMRVGGTTRIPIDTRVICATKVDLRNLVERRLFRSDLFYRINVVPVDIPALRDRREDISLLVQYFLGRYAPHDTPLVEEPAMRALNDYAWPGNVRELKNTVQRLALFNKKAISLADLPREIRNDNPLENVLKTCGHCFANGSVSLDQLLSCLEFNLLRRTLEECHGNRSEAARKLRLRLSTFRDRLAKYGLDHIADDGNPSS